MIRRYFMLVGLVFAALLLQGCPKGVAINLYNNSKNELTVQTQRNEQLAWGPGSSLRFQSGKSILKATHDERGNIVPLMSVKKGANSFEYKLSFYGLPDEYISGSTGMTFTSGTIEYNLQLEEDGNLYVVKSGLPVPTKSLKPQPLGFPIKPARQVE